MSDKIGLIPRPHIVTVEKGEWTDIPESADEWNDWQKQKLVEGVARSKTYAEIGEEIDKSAAACRGKIGRMRRKRKTRTQDSIRTLLAYGDEHHPYEDPDATWLMWEMAERRIKPDAFVNMGDTLDCPSLSNFVKVNVDEISPVQLNDAKEGAKADLAKRRNTFPDALWWLLEGNHDARWLIYIATNAPQLLAIPELRLETILKLSDLDVRYVQRKPNGVSLKIGKLHLGHWNRYSKHSAYTAKALVDDLGVSLIQAHTHRLGAFHKTWADRQVVGYENGCLCRLDPKYMDHPNWQQGFSVVHFNQYGHFQVENIQIVRVYDKGIIFAFYGGEYFERGVE